MAEPADIRLLVLDVDGVMTDGRVTYDDRGHQVYHFDVQDGSALYHWRRAGGVSAIITGRASVAVTRRARELEVPLVFQRALPKIWAFEKCLELAGVAAEQTCYVGDDLPDLACMERCGYPATVANAADEVRSVARYVAGRQGGHGAVREIVEHLLRQSGSWEGVVRGYGQNVRT